MDEATTDLTQCLICDWHIENDKLRERIKELKCEIEELRGALLQHREDLHNYSKRPCPTCRRSAAALNIKVPDQCARVDWDKQALKG